MKKIVRLFILAILLLPFSSHAQDLERTDSIYRLLVIAPGDTNLVKSLTVA